MNELKLTSSLLAFWRHELFSPINIIQGYSDVVLEEIEDLPSDPELDHLSDWLEGIRSLGQDTYAKINKILCPSLLAKQGFVEDTIPLRSLLELEVKPQVQKISTEIRNVLDKPSLPFKSDIEKILFASEKLNDLISQDISWLLDSSNCSQSVQDNNSRNTALSDLSVELIPACKKASEGCREDLQRSRVLIVDNNLDNQELLYRHLVRERYDVGTADCGEVAISILHQREYDIILLDIIMPGMSGYQVLQYIKASQLKNIPVIMISSLNEIDSITKCIEMGAEDYLPKPFNSTILKARIDACLEKKRLQDQEKKSAEKLAAANEEISALNQKLKAENIRLSAELEITRRLQQLILPRDSELKEINKIDIAGFMQPAEEVGGDYYDVHQYNGSINLSIGDVTGHGLESGLLMIMVQTAMRTLIENNETDQKKILNTLNRIILNNAKRIGSERNLTLLILNYLNGELKISGQHEDIIIVRADGKLERIDTTYLGFPIGLDEDIDNLIGQMEISLDPGDVVALYTDGVTEAEDINGNPYGVERLCSIIEKNHRSSAQDIRDRAIDDLIKFVNSNKLCDDITLLVFKQK